MKWSYRSLVGQMEWGGLVAFLLFTLVFFGGARHAVAGEVVLTSAGRSDYSIVVKQDAAPPEQFAGHELQKYLRMISDAELRVAPVAPSRKAIFIGDAAGNDVLAELAGRGKEAYLVQVKGDSLYLAGASPRGTLFSVYDFLENELGCGWIAPGDDHVPRRLDVRLPSPLHRIDSPAFDYRAMALFPLADEQFRDKLRINALFPFSLEQIDKDRIDWAAKNRLNYVTACTNTYGPALWEKIHARTEIVPQIINRGLGLQCCGHSYFAWVPPGKYWKDHPDYYSGLSSETTAVGESTQGKQPLTLNLANPKVARVMAENIDDFLNKNPEVSIVTVWMNDTDAICTTPACLQMEGPARLSISQPDGGFPPIYSFSNAALQFVNEVARQVSQTHPHVMISHLAYEETIDAPTTVKPEKNVIVTFAPIQRAPFRLGAPAGYYRALSDAGNSWNRLYLQEIRKWLALTNNFYIWDYYSLWWIFGSNRPRWPFPIMDTINTDLRFYHSDLGLSRVSSEIADWHEGNMYVYTRLAWNPSASWREALQDFCRRSYGPAAEAMLGEWLLLENAKEKWIEKKPECDRYLQQALRDAETPEVRQRIDRVGRLLHESDCQRAGDPVGPCKPEGAR
jgi:hypothetical protein